MPDLATETNPRTGAEVKPCSLCGSVRFASIRVGKNVLSFVRSVCSSVSRPEGYSSLAHPENQ